MLNQTRINKGFKILTEKKVNDLVKKNLFFVLVFGMFFRASFI